MASGSVAEFTVKATGDIFQFQWQKDGTDIHDHGSRYRRTDTNTLQILMVNKSDEGCYRCLVKNYKREEFSSDAILTVSKLVLTSYTGLICVCWKLRSIIHNYFTIDTALLISYMNVADAIMFQNCWPVTKTGIHIYTNARLPTLPIDMNAQLWFTLIYTETIMSRLVVWGQKKEISSS